jgi:HPr kinase/phosphorylase
MTAHISVGNLFHGLHMKLGLKWAGGRAGENRPISPAEPGATGVNLVGHLNFIRPNTIQVLGVSELDYLESLGKNSYHDATERLFCADTATVIIADNQTVPPNLIDLSNERKTPLLSSEQESHKAVNHLRYFLGNLLAEKMTMHGVFMEVMGIGVLLTGESSIGKSELALELITRGHRLIADDAPEFSLVAPDIISGTCPEVLREFLEVRGLGVVNIRAMFGDSAIKASKYLRLIIRLQQMSEEQLAKIDRLQGSRRSRKLLGVDIPEITLPVAPGRNLAVLVETAVRNHILSEKGYEAYRDFIERQQRIMNRGNV